MSKSILSPDATYLEINKPGEFQKFLQELIDLLKRKLQRKNIIPLYLTEEHIKSSCDVYPLEYIKMKKDFEILHGSDVLTSLSIPNENIRLECEQKIKGALIRITQIILESGDNKKRLSNIAFLAMEDILSGIEGILETFNISGYTSNLELLQKAEDQFKLELSSIKEIEEWKEGKKPADLKKLIYEFYETLEALADFVDKLEFPK